MSVLFKGRGVGKHDSLELPTVLQLQLHSHASTVFPQKQPPSSNVEQYIHRVYSLKGLGLSGQVGRYVLLSLRSPELSLGISLCTLVSTNPENPIPLH